MKRNLLQICAAVLCASLFGACGLVGNTCKKSSDKENQNPDFKITVMRTNLQAQEHNKNILEALLVPILTSSNEELFYLYDDEASYDDLAYACILADIIVDKLMKYTMGNRVFSYRPKPHNIEITHSEETIQYTLDLINRYINYVFDLPITDQIDDPQIKEIFNKVYYDTKEKPIYRGEKGYGFCTYRCGNITTKINRLTEDDLSYGWSNDRYIYKGLEDYYGAIEIGESLFRRQITEIRSGSVPESARSYSNLF